ncbi:uncharacterized protein LOC122327392 isoform X2 [Puntigrus tetrazona]|nr:uncharacterized protein LOC122327392 isoform X2 [Puntigrus tetrazona]
MRNLALIGLFPLLVNVVSGDAVESLSVIVGDSVSLQTDSTIESGGVIEWRFEGHLIARINYESNKKILLVDANEKFRDRLKLDDHTGDLQIRNVRTSDSGIYKVEIYSGRGISTNAFNVTGVINLESDGVKVVPVMERDSVILPSGLSEIQREDEITWKFKDTLIAEMNRKDGVFSAYEDVLDGRFRDKLQLDNKTGSLIITNIRPNISGLYEISISRSSRRYTTHKMFSVTSVEGENRMSAMEGTTVILQSDISEIHSDDVVVWRSEHGDSIIATINRRTQNVTVLDGDDGRFGGILELDSKTGSLTIRHIKTKHAGLYHLDIIGHRRTVFKRFYISVCPQNGHHYVMGIVVLAVLLLVVTGAAVWMNRKL